MTLREAIARNAGRHAEDLREVVEEVRGAGHRSLGATCILTRRGGRWHESTFINLLARPNVTQV